MNHTDVPIVGLVYLSRENLRRARPRLRSKLGARWDF